MLLLSISMTLSAQNYDFRNVTWGMDTIQVRNSETSQFLYSKNSSLIFQGKLSDFDAKVVYDFSSSNQLYQAFYLITLNSKTPALYVKNYQMLQELLTKKYAEPKSRSAFTINGKIITQDEWASNLISDNLNLETHWKTGRTDITLFLYSINDELCIEIRYTSIDFLKKADEEKKVNLLKNL